MATGLLLWLLAVEGDAEPLLSLPVATVFFVSEGLPAGEDAFEFAAESCSNIRLASLTLLLGLVGLVTALGLSAAALALEEEGAGLSLLSFLAVRGEEVLEEDEDDLDFFKPPRLPKRLATGDDILTHYLHTKEHTHTIKKYR